MARTSATQRKALKGIVAAATGVALLLGGAGTFALWRADVSLRTDGPTTGELKIDNHPRFTWYDMTYKPGKRPTDSEKIKARGLKDFRLVPGDTIVGTARITVNAKGDNLYVVPSITGGQDGTLSFLADADPGSTGVTVTTALKNRGTDVPNIKGSSSPQYFTAVVTIKFDPEAKNRSAGGSTMGQKIDLSNVKFVLQQVAPNTSTNVKGTP